MNGVTHRTESSAQHSPQGLSLSKSYHIIEPEKSQQNIENTEEPQVQHYEELEHVEDSEEEDENIMTIFDPVPELWESFKVS